VCLTSFLQFRVIERCAQAKSFEILLVQEMIDLVLSPLDKSSYSCNTFLDGASTPLDMVLLFVSCYQLIYQFLPASLQHRILSVASSAYSSGGAPALGSVGEPAFAALSAASSHSMPSCHFTHYTTIMCPLFRIDFTPAVIFMSMCALDLPSGLVQG